MPMSFLSHRFRLPALSSLCILALAACVPQVDRTYISDTPASPASFAVAQQAARACKHTYDRKTRDNSFRRAGFKVVEQPVTKNGRTFTKTEITAPDDAVHVIVSGLGQCWVGLEGMTPEQSAELAQIWVYAFDAEPNSASGNGLSDHVSGAWRNFFVEPERFPDKPEYEHRIYIAAYKTWPHGPYDPQRSVAFDVADFPKVPGAAIALSHAVECNSPFPSGSQTPGFLECTSPEFRPR